MPLRAEPLFSFSGHIPNSIDKVKKDRHQIWLRDLVVLTDDRILVSDFSNGIKLFNSKGNPLGKFAALRPPSAVTLLSPTRVAYTIPFDSGPNTVILDIDLETGALTHVKTVHTSVNYRGIAALDEKSWVTSTAWWNGAGAIDVVDMDGNILKSFNTTNEKRCMLECSSHLTVSPLGHFVASDGNASKVIAVDPKADDNPVSFVYDGGKEGVLELPLGIDCDDEGRIYVADHKLNHVVVLSSDGSFLQTIFDGENGDLLRPTGVRIFKDILYITEKDRSVKAFKLIFT